MRPRLHFTADSGWINDPHGITYRDGRYHLFYQYAPDSLVWSPHCHWGHAVSPDLLRFDRLPVAISPGDGDDGIWTGSMAHDEGSGTIFYTSVRTPALGIGRVRSATPDDPDWRAWTKGPVVVEAPPQLDLVAFRDPFVLHDGTRWRMLVGAALADGVAAALSYSSPDLVSWTYDGIAASRSSAERDPVWTGALWECPQLFELDGRHVLVTSVWFDNVLHYAAYAVGRYADGVFAADTWGQLSYGPSYYAPSLFRDEAGRPSLTFWLRGVEDGAAGWTGAHSVPHTLTLDGDRLVATPHARLAGYRSDQVPSGHVDGLAADATWSPESGSVLHCHSGGVELFQLRLGPTGLVLDQGQESWAMPYDGGPVRLVVDGPVVEVSARLGLLALPLEPLGPDLDLTAESGALTVWPLDAP
ncbi:MAG TPA: glycoside hydrolase family 32 protein [Propionibacteriaceae bacterium]|jgi:beta-fructofuranosidase|nr:glycoside hydrolase family 32 protein [Propionibacteriaceae bacterium]